MFDRSVKPVAHWFLRHWIRHDELVRIRQQIRYLSYAELLHRSQEDRDLSLFELSVFSQNGEDGIIHEIFRKIGSLNHTFVEIGASPNEANSVLLADVFGWSGTFFDVSPSEISGLRSKYSNSDRVNVVEAFVTPSNIANLLRDASCPEGFDFLSIDVDGNDYWLWEAVEPCRPRVVVIEYNSAKGSQVNSVNKYQSESWDGTTDFGATLSAMIDLGDRLGYQLVHAETTGVNLFFVRKDQFQENDFLSPSEVRTRIPNFYLYGLHHPNGKNSVE